MNGYIVKGIGGFYYVKTPDGIVECKPRGIFRKQKITPVAGDEVTLETENGASVIAQIAPRKNVFVRPPVANLDVLFLVASTTQPTPSTLVLDKLSAIWRRQNSCAVRMKNLPCRSSASTTAAEPGWTRSNSGSADGCARSAATPVWASPRCSTHCCRMLPGRPAPSARSWAAAATPPGK